jgi:type IV pilus assembly protein PilC
VALGLLIGIVPKFANVFAQLNSELPPITKVMLALSGAVTNPLIMGGLGGLLVGAFFAGKSYYATSNGRLVLDRLVFSVPLFGSLLLKYEVASFCETLATLTNAGIPAVEGMEVTAGASNNQVIKNTIRFTAQRAEQGEVISEVLASTRIFPPLVAAMIRIGEESGQLSTMLENLGRFYTQEIEITVKQLTKAMEPAITGVVSVIVGSIVLSLYLPMFKLMEVMGK